MTGENFDLANSKSTDRREEPSGQKHISNSSLSEKRNRPVLELYTLGRADARKEFQKTFEDAVPGPKSIKEAIANMEIRIIASEHPY